MNKIKWSCNVYDIRLENSLSYEYTNASKHRSYMSFTLRLVCLFTDITSSGDNWI